MDVLERYSGVLQGDKGAVLFSQCEDEFEFIFLTNVIYNIFEPYEPITLSAKNGFIYGKIHDNRNIAIYVGKECFEVWGSRRFCVPAFIVSDRNVMPEEIDDFDEIVFEGGTLNRIFNVGALKVDFKDGKQLITINNDSREMDINSCGKKLHVMINSIVSFTNGTSHKSVENSSVRMSVAFDKPQPANLFWEYYDDLNRLLSFMTFRKNVGVEKISLWKKGKEHPLPNRFATIYVRKDLQLTQKDYQRSITVESMKESFSKVMEVFFSNRENEPLLEFLPHNDSDVFLFSRDRIRDICSSLEREFELSKSNMKEEIRKYKKEKREKEEKEGKKGNIKIVTVDKIVLLFRKHRENLQHFNESGIDIGEGEIGEYVKYRHHITHGHNPESMSEKVALAAYVLSGLVYCNTLTRMGTPDATIAELARSKMIW